MDRLGLAVRARSLPRRGATLSFSRPLSRRQAAPYRRISPQAHRPQATIVHPVCFHRRAKMATAPAPDASATAICAAFNPAVFDKIRKLWFQNVADDTQLIIPTMELAKQWFTSDAAFDKICA